MSLAWFHCIAGAAGCTASLVLSNYCCLLSLEILLFSSPGLEKRGERRRWKSEGKGKGSGERGERGRRRTHFAGARRGGERVAALLPPRRRREGGCTGEGEEERIEF